jgi:antirestriction protein ArdC
MDMRAFETGDPRWATYHQAQEAGWQVKKGAKSVPVFFYKPLEVEDEKAKDGTRVIPIMRTFHVFHSTDIDGIPPHKVPDIQEAPWTRPDAADLILKNSGAIIRIGGDRAFYSPATDHIGLPPENAFRGPPEWAATALHELGHWTGHKSRLDRDDGMKARYGSAAYAMEELRAELSSAFIAAELGIPSEIDGHASYISNWLGPLKKDKREIFRCAADAQKIVDMVLGFHPDFAIRPQEQHHQSEDPSPEETLQRTGSACRSPEAAPG